MDRLRALRDVLRETLEAWLEDEVIPRGAALSYYVVFSLGPLLVLLTGALQAFLSRRRARSTVLDAVASVFGTEAASTVQTVLAEVSTPDVTSWGSITTLLLLLMGATAVFANVRGALNGIWGVQLSDGGIGRDVIRFLRSRLLGFLMILVTGGLILLSVTASSALALLAPYVSQLVPSNALAAQIVDALLSIAVMGLLFAALFRTLPDVDIPWRSVWGGGYATAVLFVAGEALLTRVLSLAGWGAYYGPGASAVAFLAWVYYSAQLFFFGAELTWVLARRRERAAGAVGPESSGGRES